MKIIDTVVEICRHLEVCRSSLMPDLIHDGTMRPQEVYKLMCVHAVSIAADGMTCLPEHVGGCP